MKPLCTAVGKADGIQPKTMETFKQLGLFHQLITKGVRVYDVTMWEYLDDKASLTRVSHEVHFPEVVDLREPYILLLHQGMVENILLHDIEERNSHVSWDTSFVDYHIDDDIVYSHVDIGGKRNIIRSKYLVGCDGAHSMVRKSIREVSMEGGSTEDCWGVIDGEIESDFPDLWTKSVVKSKENGSVLIIPRERNQTRFYVQLDEDLSKCTQEQIKKDIQEKSKKIFRPYFLEWNTVEWIGVYKVGQRVASNFTDRNRVFIVGDASHTHSPKAAQGMNVSIHDSWNLGWKLASVLRNFSQDNILTTYVEERKKIGHDLINFDKKHASTFKGGTHEDLVADFEENVKFISGLGAEYDLNLLNQGIETESNLKPGQLLLPADALRCMDTNPVELENAIPALGQFKLFILASNLEISSEFLESFSESFMKQPSLQGFTQNNSMRLEQPENEWDLINRRRYTPIFSMFTLGLIFSCKKYDFELKDLPPLFAPYKWSIFVEEGEKGPSYKWFTKPSLEYVKLLVVRPDSYVGSLSLFFNSSSGAEDAATWVNNYFRNFLI